MSTKCAAFWHHTNLRSDDKIFPCCRYKEPIMTFNGNLSEVLHDPVYDDLRKKAVDNEYIPGCEKCYIEEKYGKKSLRQKFNEEYDTVNISLDYLEVGLDNVCNLTCDGCFDDFSHSWAQKNNPSIPIKTLIKKTSEINNIPDSINQILFLGGEPLMTNQHKRFLKKFKNLNQIEVTYNTNGMFLLDSETIQLLGKTKKTKFIVSIDGFEDLQEKVRSGSDWNKILEFIDQISKYGYDISVNTVLHLNNWHGLDKLANFVRLRKYKWTVNILTYPTELCITNFNDKEILLNYIQGLDLPDKKYIENFIKNENCN